MVSTSAATMIWKVTMVFSPLQLGLGPRSPE